MSQTEFIVMQSAARMPSSCWGRYVNLALCEVERGVQPKMISPRARGMVQIVDYRGKCHDGKTDRSESARVRAALQARADVMNAEATA